MKRFSALLLSALLLLCLLAGCSPSPTAVIVGGRKVDASEYAFYLHYNRVNSGEDDSTVIYSADALETARADRRNTRTRRPSLGTQRPLTLRCAAPLNPSVRSAT